MNAGARCFEESNRKFLRQAPPIKEKGKLRAPFEQIGELLIILNELAACFYSLWYINYCRRETICLGVKRILKYPDSPKLSRGHTLLGQQAMHIPYWEWAGIFLWRHYKRSLRRDDCKIDTKGQISMQYGAPCCTETCCNLALVNLDCFKAIS